MLSIHDPAYWQAITARPDPPAWPDIDPVPVVTNRDARPAGAPADPRAVAGLLRAGRAGGWAVMSGYSRGPMRAQKTGTYKDVEVIGVWAGVHPETGWRWYAMHERTTGAATGWKWARITIWRPGTAFRFTHATVTDLKTFLASRGTVERTWFAAIAAREEAKTAKAKTRTTIGTTKAREGAS